MISETTFHGPKCWILSVLVGLGLGWVWANSAPEAAALIDGRPNVPVFLAAPFVLLLLSIALMPFIHARFWEHHYPDFALLLGGTVSAYYLCAYRGYLTAEGPYGPLRMSEAGLDYVQFIALIGSLYVVSGGILIEIKGQGSPALNTLLLGVGAVAANVFGTTGAAALLIRPYIRVNKHRIRPFHIILFIFIVANCGGCLTPVGDPPLFLGYLKGIPFGWPIRNCFPAWATALAMLLLVFYVLDSMAYRKYRQEHTKEASDEKTSVRISGAGSFAFLGVVIFGIFLDGLLKPFGLPHLPYGAGLQIVAAVAAHRLSRPENLAGNQFSFNPIKEVGLLFVGIFATMVPALDYLANNAGSLGIRSPTAFYFASGSLSSFLDNAPTYLNFLTAAHGLAGKSVGTDTKAWLELADVGSTGFAAPMILLAISLGSVFFGACTYIGNGPNFMVKAISEASGVEMPSFFGYIVKYTVPILLPIFAVIWVLYVR